MLAPDALPVELTMRVDLIDSAIHLICLLLWAFIGQIAAGRSR